MRNRHRGTGFPCRTGATLTLYRAQLAATVQGSTGTTFYVLAVYFGAAGIRHTRHAIPCGLAADLAGISSAIAVSYWFYSN